MFDMLGDFLRRAKSSGKFKGVLKKFRSRSRHQAVLNDARLEAVLVGRDGL